jgi:hypothetical protein
MDSEHTNKKVCGICFEGAPLSDHFQTTSCCCVETCCNLCLKKWIEAEEKTGVQAPSCPFCRECLKDDMSKVTILLGRDFTPRQLCKDPNSSSSSTTDASNIDDLTLQYLQTHTRPCPACGSYIEKSHGCSLMECICGYRFCFSCGAVGAACSCDGPNHMFERNVNFEFRQSLGLSNRREYFISTMAVNNERRFYIILRQQKARREEYEMIDEALKKTTDYIEKGSLIQKQQQLSQQILKEDEQMSILAAQRRSTEVRLRSIRTRRS